MFVKLVAKTSLGLEFDTFINANHIIELTWHEDDEFIGPYTWIRFSANDGLMVCETPQKILEKLTLVREQRLA